MLLKLTFIEHEPLTNVSAMKILYVNLLLNESQRQFAIVISASKSPKFASVNDKFQVAS